jgi:hypothetical protein
MQESIAGGRARVAAATRATPPEQAIILTTRPGRGARKAACRKASDIRRDAGGTTNRRAAGATMVPVVPARRDQHARAGSPQRGRCRRMRRRHCSGPFLPGSLAHQQGPQATRRRSQGGRSCESRTALGAHPSKRPRVKAVDRRAVGQFPSGALCDQVNPHVVKRFPFSGNRYLNSPVAATRH